MLEVRSFLKDPDFFADPYALYERWRTEAPVRWEPALNGWCVTSHAAVTAALADPHLSSDRTEAYLAAFPLDARETLCPFARARSDMMLFVDPPKHTRLRGLVQKAFTPKMIEQLRPHIEQLVSDFLSPASSSRSCWVCRPRTGPSSSAGRSTSRRRFPGGERWTWS